MTGESRPFGCLENLHASIFLDDGSRSALAELTQLAAQVLNSALVFVVAHGPQQDEVVAATGWPLKDFKTTEMPFLSATLGSGDIFISTGAETEIFKMGAQPVHFYAGVRLQEENGEVIGAFGIIDFKPRELAAGDRQNLHLFGRQALTHLRLARQVDDCEFRQRLLEGIIQSEPECVKVLDRNGFVKMINPAGLRMLEADNIAEASRRSLLENVAPKDREAAADLIERVFGGETAQLTFKFTGFKGGQRWLQINARPLRDGRGEVIALIGVTRDLTARIRAETQCSESEGRREALLQALGEVVYEWNPLTDELIWDGAFTEALGYSAEEIGNTTESWTDRVHPDDLEEVMAEVEAARVERRKYDLEYRFRHRDGHYCWMHDRGVLTLGENGELRRIIGVLIEISGRKRVEEALRRANERYSRQRQALTSLTRAQHDQGMDIDTAFREVTRIVAESLNVARVSIWTFNAARTQLVCQNLFELGSGAHSSGQEIAAASCPKYFAALASEDILAIENAPGDPRTSELAVDYLVPLGIDSMLDAPIRLDGELTGVLCNEQMGGRRRWTEDEQGFVVAMAGFITLVLAQAQHQKIEEQLRQAQKMEAIGQLAGGVAHDFNNILAVVMMQTELLATEELPPEVSEGLSEIRSAAERAANLTRQLLLFSRKQVLQPKELDLNEVVGSLTRMLERIIGADVAFAVKLSGEPLLTRADPGMLDQILLNLAVNARDAMPAGGRLLIESKRIEVTQEMGRLFPDAAPGFYVGFCVSDTGVGIESAIMQRIFEPFFTTKEQGKGTGLGLATVFGIVKQHQGWMRVASEPGKGSAFEVYLPELAGAKGPEPEDAPVTRARGGKEGILLAEDDRAVRFLTRAVLERNGYKVFEASTAPEAIEVWEKNPDAIHLLLTDLVMPGGATGLQLAKHLRQKEPRLKVIFTSGYSAEIAGRELELRNGENFLQKPSPPEFLLVAVRRCLDS